MCSSACSVSLCARYVDVSAYLTLLECYVLFFYSFLPEALPCSTHLVDTELYSSLCIGFFDRCIALYGKWLCGIGASGVKPVCSVCRDVYCAGVCWRDMHLLSFLVLICVCVCVYVYI
jgi:hypothetical protein